MSFLPIIFLSERSRRAFTLLELLAVVAIILLLVGLVVGTARRAVESGRIARAKAELGALSAALESYQRTYGDYPQTGDGARMLQSLLGKFGPTGAPLQDRALLETTRFNSSAAPDVFTDADAVLVDPWGRPYVYLYKEPLAGWTNPSFVLYSTGPDGRDTPGLLPDGNGDPSLAGNADNIYASRY